MWRNKPKMKIAVIKFLRSKKNSWVQIYSKSIFWISSASNVNWWHSAALWVNCYRCSTLFYFSIIHKSLFLLLLAILCIVHSLIIMYQYLPQLIAYYDIIFIVLESQSFNIYMSPSTYLQIRSNLLEWWEMAGNLYSTENNNLIC